MNKSIKMKSKKTKTVRDKRFLSAKDYEMMEQQLKIVYGDDNNETVIY